MISCLEQLGSLLHLHFQPEPTETQTGLGLEDPAEILRAQGDQPCCILQRNPLVVVSPEEVFDPLRFFVDAAGSHLLGRFSLFYEPPDYFPRPVYVNGLFNVIVSSSLECLNHCGLRAMTGKNDDAEVRAHRFYVFEDFRTRLARHNDIQDYNVDFIRAAEQVKSLSTIGGFNYIVVMKKIAELLSEHLVVVYKQNVIGHGDQQASPRSLGTGANLSGILQPPATRFQTLLSRPSNLGIVMEKGGTDMGRRSRASGACKSFAAMCLSALVVVGCSEKACDTRSEVPASSVWSGYIGAGSLRLELNELNEVVTGRAIVTWPASLDSVPIRAGWRSGPDSFYLDLTEVPAPIGCSRMLMARYIAPYGADGVFWERCGHDPVVFRLPLSAGKLDGEASLYGSWVGSAGRATLQMELAPTGADSIAGYIRLRWPSTGPETLTIRDASGFMADSVFLDVSDIPPAPFGCYRTISGHFEGEDWMRGSFFEHCGHDPTSLQLEWSAVRVEGSD